VRRFILTVPLLCLAAFPALAQRILPSSVAAWQPCSQAAASPLSSNPPGPAPSSRDALPENEVAYPNDVLSEYGLSSTEKESYCRGSELLDATLFRMNDPSGAYGVYSYLRTPGMSRADFTDHSSLSNDRALVLVGNLVLDIRGRDLRKNVPDLKALVASVEPRAQEGPLPELWQRLPTKNVVEGTDRYVLGPQTLNQLFPGGLGDSLGFSKGAEAEVAHYRVGGHDATLLIADFPTPQLAEQTLAGLEMKFNVNGSKAAPSSPPLFAKRSLTIVAIVSGAPSETEANALLNQVHSGTVLTWNEPTFQFKEPSIEVMVVGGIVGTGAICVFALIAGVAFGGVRLIVKRFFPGKVFDRGSHLQVLQLGLGSKPINSDDFYATGATSIPNVQVDKNLPDRIALRIFR